MRITVEPVIDPDTIATFYALYATAFDPMRVRAAARHLLTEAEFTAEMLDDRIEKHVARADGGDPLALTTLTRDLSTVTWISPDFYAVRYPEHAARGALYYLGYTLVHPGEAGHGVVRAMLDRIVRRLVRERAVCVFDVSAYNDGRAVGRFVGALPRRYNAHVEAVDVQTYFGVTFDRPAGEASSVDGADGTVGTPGVDGPDGTAGTPGVDGPPVIGVDGPDR